MADQRSPRDGRFIEMLGHYNPQTQPSEVKLDRERLDHWLARGAQPTNTVRKLMRAEEITPAETAQAAEETPVADLPAETEPAPAEEAPAEAPAAEEPAAGEAEAPAG